MVLPGVIYHNALPKLLLLLALFIDCITFSISTIIYYVGLNPQYSGSRDHGLYLQFRRSTMTDASASPLMTPSSVKSRLRVVEFKKIKKMDRMQCHGYDEQPSCAVCLGVIEDVHQVRKLGNCSHVFHSGCIEEWVELGHPTCPLCRAHLLPSTFDGKMAQLRKLLLSRLR